MSFLGKSAGSQVLGSCWVLAAALSSCRSNSSPPRVAAEDKVVIASTGVTGAPPPSLQQLSSSELQGLSLGDLLLLRDERRSQNQGEITELASLTALNQRWCSLLQDTRTACPLFRPLVGSDQEKFLQCDGSYRDTTLAPVSLTVTIPGDKKGSFILVANDKFASNSFGPGLSTLSFHPLADDAILSKAPGGEAEQKVPAPGINLKQITKLALRPSPEASSKPLPDLKGFTLNLSLEGTNLLTTALLPSTDGTLAQKKLEYLVDMQKYLEFSRSSACTITPAIIQGIKDQVNAQIVSSSAAGTQPSNSDLATVSDDAAERRAAVSEVQKIQNEIAGRYNALEDARNRNYKLSAELSSNNDLGCHINAPITSLVLELEGKASSRVAAGDFDQPQKPPAGSGKPSELKVDLGGLSFVVDIKRENIFGGHYQVPQNFSQSLSVGSIDRVILRKQGVNYDNERFCEREFIIISEKCRYHAYEQDVFNISAIRLFVNGKLFYQGENLKVKLDRKRLQVAFPNLYSNPAWVQLMQEKDCTDVR